MHIAENICKTFSCMAKDNCRNNKLPTANDVAVGTTYYKVRSMLPNDPISVVKNYYQIGKASLLLETKLEILQQIIREPLFNALRTQEQLGYSVASSVKRDYKMLGFVISVESQEVKHPACMVDEKIEFFLRKFTDTLQSLSDDDFDTIKDAIVATKLATDTDLITEVERNWIEVMRGRNKFERSKLEIRKMENVSKSDVVKLYEEHFICPESVRKLSVQVLANIDSDQETDLDQHVHLHLNVL